MKKIIISAILILVLLSCASCDNYKQYPSDDATRYPTLAEALDINEDQIRYYFEDGNIVYVSYSTGGGGHTLFIYKDNGGYVCSSTFREHSWDKFIACEGIREKCLLTRAHYADKYVITLKIITLNYNVTPTISDNLNSSFQYKEFIYENSDSTVKSAAYFLVLDEIPEDYEIYVDGVTYTVNQLTNSDLLMIIVFGSFFAILLTVITLIIIKKVKIKKHKAKLDNIWGVK